MTAETLEFIRLTKAEQEHGFLVFLRYLKNGQDNRETDNSLANYVEFCVW